MLRHLKLVFLLILVMGPAGKTLLLGQAGTDRYLKPAEINTRLDDLKKKFPAAVQVRQLAVSPGGIPVKVIEIGPTDGTQPAVLVVGNVEGIFPVASMGALYLAETVASDPARYKDLSWYIVPALNPDGAMHYFNTPLYQDGRNALKVNDDFDEATDEDGYNDLDGNGIITRMRVKDPAGEWIPVSGEPRLMKKADPSKGEKGLYKLYTEGIDDDGDGAYNEDLPGGTDPGLNFPHLFHPFTTTGGRYAGSSPEVYGLMKYAFDHPEIAMGFSFGGSDFCIAPPRGGRRGSADMDRIKIPERQARMFNADPDKTYTMKEIMEMVQPMLPPGMEVSESMIASFLGLGAVVNPLDADLKFYRDLSEKYKEYLKEKGYPTDRLDPVPDRDGSFELWVYYQLGLPSFAMNLFTLPKVKEEKKEGSGLTVEKIGTMSDDEFVALGEEKVDAFLKENGAPPQYKGSMVIQMVKSGQLSAKQVAGMMKQMGGKKDTEGIDPKEKAFLAFSDQELDGKGFVNWKTYNHPVLGEVEIGGEVPYVENNPPALMLDSLLGIEVPWVFQLAEKLPRLSILEVKTKDLGAGVYRIEVWIRNEHYLPFPTAMGERNERPAPAILLLEGKDLQFLEGLPRTPVKKVGGFQNHKEEFLVRIPASQTLTVRLSTKNAWGDVKTVKIGG